MEEACVKNRREIIFLYDVGDSNPNGDPDDDNRPRMDDDGFNIITDVRLKRTIRDYWLKKNGATPEKGMDIIIRKEIIPDTTDIKTMADLVLEALGLEKEIMKKKNPTPADKNYRAKALHKIITELPATFFDVRTFGAAVTVKNANHSFTGPVQFGIGRSLNKPEIKTHTITTTFAASSERGQGTFGAFHVVDYSCILFHGLICEYIAKDMGFSEKDLAKLYEGIWQGTKMINTRSKFNHHPRLLLSVVSKKDSFQIGDIDKYISLEKKEGIKDIQDVKIDFSKFLERLGVFKKEILKIEYLEDPDVSYINNNNEYDTFEKLKNSNKNTQDMTIELISW